MQPLRSVEQAGEVLGISPWTVRSYIKTGKLRPVRIGRRVLVEEAELERFVAEGKKQIGVEGAATPGREALGL
jgi:excisionase family DNA binding protein